MKHYILPLLAGTLFACTVAAQSPSGAQASASADSKTSAQASKSGAQAANSTSGNASAQAGQNSASLAQGTTMNAVLTKPVDCKKSKPGDKVEGKTTENTKSGGQVVVPKGSKLVGHVTEAKARGKGESESSLGFVFDKAILKNGQEVLLNANVQALAAAESMASSSLAAPDLAGSGMGNASGSGGARSSGGGGLVGGVASTAGGSVGAVTNTAANVGGNAAGTVGAAAGSTVNAAGSATSTLGVASKGAIGGLNSAGQLTSNSQGVFGLNGLNLNAAGSNSTQGSLITSADKNIHLDSGTRMLLAAQGTAGASAQGESSGSAAAKKPASTKPETKPEPKSQQPDRKIQ